MSPLYNRSMVQIRRDISRDSSVVIRHRSLISPTSPNERASAKRSRRFGGRGGLSLHRECRCKMSAGEKREGGDGRGGGAGGGVATASNL